MKRRRPIPEQGHDPKPTLADKFRECTRCHDVRLATLPWRRPCPPSAADAHDRKYMGE